MKVNIVEETEPFSDIYDASDFSEKIWIDKVKNQLAENLIAKPADLIVSSDLSFSISESR